MSRFRTGDVVRYSERRDDPQQHDEMQVVGVLQWVDDELGHQPEKDIYEMACMCGDCRAEGKSVRVRQRLIDPVAELVSVSP